MGHPSIGGGDEAQKRVRQGRVPRNPNLPKAGIICSREDGGK
jgi:hypothetical protein